MSSVGLDSAGLVTTNVTVSSGGSGNATLIIGHSGTVTLAAGQTYYSLVGGYNSGSENGCRQPIGYIGNATNFVFHVQYSGNPGTGTNIIFRIFTNGVFSGVALSTTGTSTLEYIVSDTTSSIPSLVMTNLWSISLSNNTGTTAGSARINWSFQIK